MGKLNKPMKTNSNLLSLILILFLCSCQSKQEKKHNSVNKETILVIYLTGDVETSSRIPCKRMGLNTYYESIVADTVQISHNDFSMINNLLKNQKTSNIESSCDSRIYLKKDSVELCIGNNNCVSNIDNKSIDMDIKTVYLIKCISGYYNFFSKEQLLCDEGIIKYGIPKNYKYQKSSPHIKRKKIVKIILIEGSASDSVRHSLVDAGC